MRKIIEWLLAEYLRWFGYRVVVHWEGARFEHAACTMKGAVAWMACYPADCDVFIYEFDHAECGRAAS